MNFTQMIKDRIEYGTLKRQIAYCISSTVIADSIATEFNDRIPDIAESIAEDLQTDIIEKLFQSVQDDIISEIREELDIDDIIEEILD